jgi:hypothetical protein
MAQSRPQDRSRDQPRAKSSETEAQLDGTRNHMALIKRMGTPMAMAILAVWLLAGQAVGSQSASGPADHIPHAPDGKLDRSAPPPRTADGKPDFTGVWEPMKNRPCPKYGCPDQQLTNEFVNLGLSVQGGLPLQPWAATLVKQRAARNGEDDPTSQCMPHGIVKMHTSPFYRKLVQTPGLLVILFEREVGYRQIFTDGRPLPPDPNPSWNGYSTGTWVGDTLVVRSTGFRDGIWLDREGNPLTEAGTITERFRRPNFGTMQIEVTVDDPKAYTKLWTVTISHVLVPDGELLDYICMENQKFGPTAK